MTGAEMRRRVGPAPVGRLATVSATGRPHLVPVCFALDGDVVYSAVDAKPKRSPRLRRLQNVAATGVATLLVDEYSDDWARLWWVRLDGRARLVPSSAAERAVAVAALTGKYAQYRQAPPAGPVLALDVERWVGWSATPAQQQLGPG